MNELMRRIAPGVAVAGVALGTVVLFDPALQAGQPANTSAGLEGAAGSSGQAPDGSAGEDPDGGTASPDDPGAGTWGQAPPITGDGADGTDGTDGSDDGTSSDGTTACSGETIVGDAAETPWGPVQVRLELAADGSVCSVQAVTYPTGDNHSARINAQAIPYLDQQATAQGVEFDAVTGATYTSEAYRQSLQSALDKR